MHLCAVVHNAVCSGKVSQETETHGSVAEPWTELGRMLQAEGQARARRRETGVVSKELAAKAVWLKRVKWAKQSNVRSESKTRPSPSHAALLIQSKGSGFHCKFDRKFPECFAQGSGTGWSMFYRAFRGHCCRKEIGGKAGKQGDQAAGFSRVLDLRWWRRKEWELGGSVILRRLSLFRISWRAVCEEQEKESQERSRLCSEQLVEERYLWLKWGPLGGKSGYSKLSVTFAYDHFNTSVRRSAGALV